MNYYISITQGQCFAGMIMISRYYHNLRLYHEMYIAITYIPTFKKSCTSNILSESYFIILFLNHQGNLYMMIGLKLSYRWIGYIYIFARSYYYDLSLQRRCIIASWALNIFSLQIN